MPFKWMGVTLVAVLVIASLWVWHYMPLLPDEIAIRVQVGRYIQDNGVAQGLYALCANRVQQVPWMFVPSALLLSLGDIHLSPIDLRFVSAGVLLLCLGMAAYTAFKNANSSAMLWLPAAFIGVAGSTLVYFRFEVFLFLHLSVCMMVLHELKQASSLARRCALGAVLLFTLLTMAYVHPQALLFIPLTAYLMYRLAFGTDIKIIKIAGCSAVFGAIAVTTHMFFKLSCEGYKQIETFWSEMVFDVTRLLSADCFKILDEKFQLFSHSFQYIDDYTINYLPALPKEALAAASGLNQIIVIALFIIMFAGIALGFVIACRLFSRFILRRNISVNLDNAVTFLFIFFPTLFYFLYDGHLYFYRSFILNLLFVIALVIGLGEFQGKWVKRLTAATGILLCGVCAWSISTNNDYFSLGLQTYEGPGTTLSRDWKNAPQRFEEFAKRCQIDLAKGGGIINDITYEAVKRYERVYQITYLGLQMSLTHVKAATVIDLLKPNYVLARCTEMEAGGLGWPADRQEGDICCKRYEWASSP